MSKRAASLKRKEQVKNDLHDLNEKCTFCILNFRTRAERNSHIFTHFKQKTCLKTEKILLYIADEWFELHVSQSCTSEKCNYEMISNPIVHIDDQLIKEEGNDLDSKCDLNYETNIKDDDSVDIQFENETEINFDSMSSTASEGTTKFERRAKKAKSKANVKNVTSKTKFKKVVPEKRAEEAPSTKSVNKSIKTKTTKCRICKQKISRKTLIHHLQLRHVPKTMDVPTCSTCGKTFSTPGNLRLHQYLHAERGRYICSYCGKDFVRNANLKEHINLHTGARPFVCSVCKKGFHRETLLINHRRIHSGEKKYRCDIENCERAYTFDIDLKRHKFSAHGIYSKKHPCFICSKIFSENKLLKKHLETHN